MANSPDTANIPSSLRGNVLLLGAVILLTGAIASPLWFWYRAADLNGLAELVNWKRRVPRVRRDLCLLAFGCFVIATLLDILEPYPTISSSYTSFAGGGILLVQAIAVTRIIRRVSETYNLRITNILAVFLPPLSPVYFQWKLNVLIRASVRAHNAA